MFGGPSTYESKRQQKLAFHDVYTIEPAVSSYLKWSESAIMFNRADHPDHVPQLGR
jgi:hypothetical protein